MNPDRPGSEMSRAKALETGETIAIEMNAETLQGLGLETQVRMTRPIADLLKSLMASGSLKKDDLVNALLESRRPLKDGMTADNRPKIGRHMNARFLTVLALQLFDGDPSKVDEALHISSSDQSGLLDPDPHSVSERIKKSSREKIPK